MALTASARALGERLVAILQACPEVTAVIPTTSIWYGQGSVVAAVPAIEVAAGTKEAMPYGTGLTYRRMVPLTVTVYHAVIPGTAAQFTAEAQDLADVVETALLRRTWAQLQDPAKALDDPDRDPLVVHSYPATSDPGVATVGGARFTAHQITVRCDTRTTHQSA